MLFLLRIDGFFAIIFFGGYEIVLDENGNVFFEVMEETMGFEFTIAVQPELTHIDKELRYIKSALLYADRITLISPMAYILYSINGTRRQF